MLLYTKAGAQHSQSPVDAEEGGDGISRFPLRPEVDFRNINSVSAWTASTINLGVFHWKSTRFAQRSQFSN